jgi:NDP-sugar pyrophosphorylase family protein
MLRIVIPMAGRGSRFSQQGYTVPKPLIPVHGVPMIRLVIENLRPSVPHAFTFICQKSHLDEFGLDRRLQDWAPGCTVIGIEGITQGAACTVLLARNEIDCDDHLMIANCDQYVNISIDDYLEEMKRSDLDGLIMTMKALDKKWSYVGFDEMGRVTRVVEKEVISSEATVGIYNFRHGSQFVSAADEMIANDLRVNGEFYVAPVYNQLIASGSKVGVYNIGSIGSGMHGLGIPEDLVEFESLELARRATARLAA